MFRTSPVVVLAAIAASGCSATSSSAVASRTTAPSGARASSAPPRTPAEPARASGSADAASASSGGAISAPTASSTGPTASDRVRAQLDATAPAPPEEAAWFPFRVLEIVARASGELPAPTSPQIRDGRVVWSLVAPATGSRDTTERSAVCDEVSRVEPRIACAADVVAVGATERARFAFGWREETPAAPRANGAPLPDRGIAADLALPLRALARLSTGACLLSVERTLHTVEVRIQAPSVPALGTSLALLATVPHLSDMIMVESEPVVTPTGAHINARLSWPTDRGDRGTGSLESDAWPARCNDRVAVGTEAPPRSQFTALAYLRGARARGAVINVARREWIVTDGDQIGDAAVASVTERGVFVRRLNAPARARPILLRFPAPGARPTVPPPRDGLVNTPGGVMRPGAIRIPVPPEPPVRPPPSPVGPPANRAAP